MTRRSPWHLANALLALAIASGIAAATAQAQQPVPTRPVARAAPAGQQAFADPQAAVDALVDAFRRRDDALLTRLFGTNVKALIPSDADASDMPELRKKFLDAYEAGRKINLEGDAKAILEVGRDGWTFPVPLVKGIDGWRFDVTAGAQEIQARQIGRNELAVIQTLLALVDAQQEYAEMDPMKTGTTQYASRLLSTPGKKDGLYWPAAPGEPESPIGDLVAQAQADGANRRDGYYGYHYRMLLAQGPKAPGGAQDYMVRNRMVGGFALLAWPVRYGKTGIVTFMVSHDGVVFEKDLGSGTPAAAAAIRTFNPDETWKKSDTTP